MHELEVFGSMQCYHAVDYELYAEQGLEVPKTMRVQHHPPPTPGREKTARNINEDSIKKPSPESTANI